MREREREKEKEKERETTPPLQNKKMLKTREMLKMLKMLISTPFKKCLKR